MADTDDDELDLPRGIALAWGIAANPQRGPKREMSVERIVEAAVEIADAEGLGAVSMAAVAARLGYTPMSLYRYVTAKDDLILLMQEEATGLPPERVREVGRLARRSSRRCTARMIQLYLEHPWMLDIPINGSPTTPNSAAWMDAGLAALAEHPADARRAAVDHAAHHRPGALGGHRSSRRTRASSARTGIDRPGHRATRGRDCSGGSSRPTPIRRCARRSTPACSSTRPTRSRSTSTRSLDGIEAYIALAARRRRRDTPQPVAAARRRRDRRRQAVPRGAQGRCARPRRRCATPARLERQAAREARERRVAPARRRLKPSRPSGHMSHTGLHASRV